MNFKCDEGNRQKACKHSIEGIKGLLHNSLNCLADQINNRADIVIPPHSQFTYKFYIYVCLYIKANYIQLHEFKIKVTLSPIKSCYVIVVLWIIILRIIVK